jgi:hypothetical protein
MTQSTRQTQQSEVFDGPDRRSGSVMDRRCGIDRRTGERVIGLDRRRGPGIRRSEERRAAEEGEMTVEQFEFIQAVNEYKQLNSRPFPTWTEVLDIITAMGYRKVADPTNIR